MKLGFVSAILEDAGFEEVIDHAAENGFACVELACWPKGKALRRYAGVTHIDVDGLTEEVCSYIEDYCCKKGVEISSLAYYPNMLDPDMEKRQFYIGHLKKLIEASAALKIGMVTTFAGRVPYKTPEENLEIFEEVWKPIIRFAEEKKVRIGFENCPMLFTNDEWPGGQNLAISPAIFREMFRRIDSPYLGLNFDPSHFVWLQMDYIKPVYEFKDRIFHVHFKDIKIHKDWLDDTGIMAVPLQYMSPKLPGLGDVDWGRFISALTDIGYKGPACLEIEDKAFEGSREQVRKALAIARKHISQFVTG